MSSPASNRELSLSTRENYAVVWALFTDWCTVTGEQLLPADPCTVVAFLAGCPAAPGTQRRRVAAIDHHHTAAGQSRPGESAVVRTALGRPVPDRAPAPPGMTDQVVAALSGLPSHGWTQGIFGRRDRCLLVLSQLAGVPYKHLATLTAGDITVVDGTATITSSAGSWLVRPDDSPILCGSCAITRWLRVVNLAVDKITTAVIADAIDKAEKVTAASPHLCRSTKTLGEATTAVSVFPPINPWGAVPFPLQPLTPHSLSRRVRDLLAGDLGAHRHLPVDRPKNGEPDKPIPVPVVERRVYGRAEQQRAWARRRDDLARIADIGDMFADLDRRITELNERAAAIVVD